MTGQLPQLSAEEVRARVSPERARRAIEKVLLNGFDPAVDPQRVQTKAGAGHLLLMPSTIGPMVGIKVASVAPGNPDRGLPRIQATYVLMDAATLTPLAIMDGAALTELRTPANSAMAVDKMAIPGAERLVVFGTGPQAIGHTVAVTLVRPLSQISIVGRYPGDAEAAVEVLEEKGITARVGSKEDIEPADIVVCATSSPEPLFEGELVRNEACVVAIGSHEPDRRELDGCLLRRAQVVVEDKATALRECGDIVMALQEGHLAPNELVGLADMVRGEVRVAADRPRVFKGSGMSWQDLAVAACVFVGHDNTD